MRASPSPYPTSAPIKSTLHPLLAAVYSTQVGVKQPLCTAWAQLNFFRENWIWIVTPMAMIVGAVLWLVFFSGSPEDSIAPHQYPMFDD